MTYLKIGQIGGYVPLNLFKCVCFYWIKQANYVQCYIITVLLQKILLSSKQMLNWRKPPVFQDFLRFVRIAGGENSGHGH